MSTLFTERIALHSVAVGGPGPGTAEAAAEVQDAAAVGVLMCESGSGPVLAEGLDPRWLADFAAGPDQGEDSGCLPDPELFARQGFSGKAGQSMTVLRSFGKPALVYLGCGPVPDVGLDALRRASAALVRSAGRSGVAVLVLPLDLAGRAAGVEPESSPQRLAAQAVAEGAVLGAYRFRAHKSEEESSPARRFVIAGLGFDALALREGTARGARVSDAVCAARDMVNEPPSSMTPTRVAEIALELTESSSRTTVEVWELERITSERLGGLIGVARGSVEPPRLVRVHYEPQDQVDGEGHAPHVVLVGKGITFDSGGLSLKTSEGMATMKTDMSGAATVIATAAACADLGVRVKVTAIAPLTENMPDGRATKPGDVLRIRDGQTIEVLNTDAEGRLVLADGLTLAAELRPDAIVDLATLTGAAVVSLGSSIAGLFANDDSLASRVLAASERAGEAMWRLPLASQYESHIESDVADMKNIGKPGQAGAIVAALLLERFVGDTPWVHIDMAGPARSDHDDGVVTKGGTGFGVRTLLEMLSSLPEEELNLKR